MRMMTRLSTPARGLLAATLGLLGGLFVSACSGDFHSNRGLEDMVCDETGCWHCDRGDCVEYRCDETHQCPMQRTCSVDQRCLPGDGSEQTPPDGSGCDSHDDCPIGEICTLEGACVKSPGGGPNTDTSTGDTSADVSSDASVSTDAGPTDASPGDTTADTSADTSDTATEVALPDHPDDACLSNGDCGTDGTCINGGCYFPCSIDGKCPPGQGCNDGSCRPLATPENQCTFNGECGTKHVCLEGTCFNQCNETLDCPAHTRCSSGLCIADTTPALQCSGPSSCTDGKGCVDGKCLSPCAEGACDAGFECRFGFCQKLTTCFDTTDCSGLDCIDGTCAE